MFIFSSRYTKRKRTKNIYSYIFECTLILFLFFIFKFSSLSSGSRTPLQSNPAYVEGLRIWFREDSRKCSFLWFWRHLTLVWPTAYFRTQNASTLFKNVMHVGFLDPIAITWLRWASSSDGFLNSLPVLFGYLGESSTFSFHSIFSPHKCYFSRILRGMTKPWSRRWRGFFHWSLKRFLTTRFIRSSVHPSVLLINSSIRHFRWRIGVRQELSWSLCQWAS